MFIDLLRSCCSGFSSYRNKIPEIHLQHQKYSKDNDWTNNGKMKQCKITFKHYTSKMLTVYKNLKSRDCPTNESQREGTRGEICMKAKGDYQVWVHSDQMVIVRQGGWTVRAVAKGNSGGLPGCSSLRSEGSHGSEVGRLDRMNVGQRHSNESWTTTLDSRGTY